MCVCVCVCVCVCLSLRKSFRYGPCGPHVILVITQSGDHYLQLITRKLRHRDVQCSLATCLLVFGNCTHNQSSDSCSFNSSINFKNRNYKLQITQDTWTFGNLRLLKSEKLCSSQISANPNIPFPHILLIPFPHI